MNFFLKAIFLTLIPTNFLAIPTCNRVKQVSSRWKGRAILMAFDKNNNEWSILLAHNATGPDVWGDFSEESHRRDRGNVVAARAVKKQTNGVYTPSMQGVPYEKSSTGDIFHFVPVTYRSGSDLYKTARNAIKDDFIWVSTSNILNKTPIMHPRHGQVMVSQGLYNFLQKNLARNIQKLSNWQTTSSSVPTITPIGSGTPSGAQWGPGYANHLYFYDAHKPYYEFTNFYASPVNIDGKMWPTTEHYFQAQKYPGIRWLQEKIRTAATPRDAFTIGRDAAYVQYKDPNWNSNKYTVMEKAVMAKFGQHANLKQLLKSTGNAIIVEDAGAKDADWGAGADYNGSNNLGKLLMKVRSQL